MGGQNVRLHVFETSVDELSFFGFLFPFFFLHFLNSFHASDLLPLQII